MKISLTMSLIALLIGGMVETNRFSAKQGGTMTSDSIPDTTGLAQAMFGAGCFWGVQATFDQLPGVKQTRVGYSGGQWDNPTYRDVCSDMTGHAEVVHLYFDPAVIGYDSLLTAFFELHDPTQLNRQGPDVGAQYRSVVYYYGEEQQKAAEEMLRRLEMSGKFNRPIVTQVVPAEVFWEGEEYHQKYLEKRGMANCHIR